MEGLLQALANERKSGNFFRKHLLQAGKKVSTDSYTSQEKQGENMMNFCGIDGRS